MNAPSKIKKIINDFLKEINDKREKIKSFKLQYLSMQKNNGNHIKSDTITLKINPLNSLFKEFENIISLSLELISSFQNEMDQIYFHTTLNNSKDNKYSNNLKMSNNLYRTYLNGQNIYNSNSVDTFNNYTAFNTYNSGLDELYYRKKNYPSLKEKTLRTLYNKEYIDDVNRQNNTIPDNHFDNKSFDPKPKNHIKKGLRTLIKEKQFGNKSCDQLIKSTKREKNSNNSKEDENLLKKINSSEKCKNYFSEKYGKGSFLNFLNKYKMGILNGQEIRNDYNIFANLIELKEEIKNNMNKNQNNNKKSNKKHNINKSDKLNDKNKFMKSNAQIGIRKNYLNKKVNSVNRNVNGKNRDYLDKKDINNRPIMNNYSNIEELIKSFEDE